MSTTLGQPAVDRIDAGEATVWAMAFHPDGRQLATGCGGRVRLWDLPSRRLAWEQTVAGLSVTSTRWRSTL